MDKEEWHTRSNTLKKILNNVVYQESENTVCDFKLPSAKQ